MWHVRSGSAIEIGTTGKPVSLWAKLTMEMENKRNLEDKMIEKSSTWVNGSTFFLQ